MTTTTKTETAGMTYSDELKVNFPEIFATLDSSDGWAWSNFCAELGSAADSRRTRFAPIARKFGLSLERVEAVVAFSRDRLVRLGYR